MVFKSCSNNFILSKHLVVIPLDGFSSSGCVVDDVSPIQLIETCWRHGVRIVFNSRQVHEVYSSVSDIVIFSHLIEDPLKRGGVSQDCSVVIDGHTVGYLAEEDD